MFVDTAKVSLKAGKGGDGAVSFRQEKYVPKGGPDGGDGGRGGNIIFRADKDTNTLVDFRFTPILTAENGRNGAGQKAAGRSGQDLILEVPVGTIIYKLAPPTPTAADKVLLADLTADGQTAIIAHGGAGGFGNAHFKSSTRQAPLIAEVGEPGEEFTALLELKTMADVGLVGLPNAGKSTFLSVVSNATPEIADYPFTTLTPQLGVAVIDGRDLLIADIPGLIAGAADGKGLGHDFLRHVDRTAVLLHLVDVYNNDAGQAYATIRHELSRYGDLANRPEIVALTKTEGVDADIIAMQEAAILAANPNAQIFAISSSAHQGLTELLRELKAVVETSRSQTSAAAAEKASANSAENAPLNPPSAKQNPNPLNTEPKSDHASSSRSELPDASADSPTLAQSDLPTIALSPTTLKNTWAVQKVGDQFVVTGEKIEKFARRTDLNNYASVNRLRDILKKLGIRAELTTQGAQPDSIISIAGKEFTLVEE